MTHAHGQRDVPIVRFTAEFWDERYAAKPAIWSGQPNSHLVDQAADLAPGDALDVGCGEGADAIWLAERGWQVTGLDVSNVALQRAAELAARSGPDIADRTTWRQTDLRSWAPSPETFDLVSGQYVHLPRADRVRVYEQLAALVRVGGTLLIAAHHPSDLETTMPRPPEQELFFTPEELVAELDPQKWEILVATAAPRDARTPEGETVRIHDTLLRARRRS